MGDRVEMEMLVRTQENARLNEQLPRPQLRPQEPGWDALRIPPPMPLRREHPEDYDLDEVD